MRVSHSLSRALRKSIDILNAADLTLIYSDS